MRKKYLIRASLLITFVALVMQSVQAAEEPAELRNETIKIQDIVQNEPALDGKMVVIEGKIDCRGRRVQFNACYEIKVSSRDLPGLLQAFCRFKAQGGRPAGSLQASGQALAVDLQGDRLPGARAPERA